MCQRCRVTDGIGSLRIEANHQNAHLVCHQYKLLTDLHSYFECEDPLKLQVPLKFVVVTFYVTVKVSMEYFNKL